MTPHPFKAPFNHGTGSDKVPDTSQPDKSDSTEGEENGLSAIFMSWERPKFDHCLNDFTTLGYVHNRYSQAPSTPIKPNLVSESKASPPPPSPAPFFSNSGPKKNTAPGFEVCYFIP